MSLYHSRVHRVPMWGRTEVEFPCEFDNVPWRRLLTRSSGID